MSGRPSATWGTSGARHPVQRPSGDCQEIIRGRQEHVTQPGDRQEDVIIIIVTRKVSNDALRSEVVKEDVTRAASSIGGTANSFADVSVVIVDIAEVQKGPELLPKEPRVPKAVSTSLRTLLSSQACRRRHYRCRGPELHPKVPRGGLFVVVADVVVVADLVVVIAVRKWPELHPEEPRVHHVVKI